MSTRPKSIYKLKKKNVLTRRGINLLVYSVPGEGKTVLAGTSPKGLIMNCDLGDESITDSDCDAVDVTNYGELEDMYQYLKHEDHGYEWVWWDSLTLFQDRTLIDEILADAHAENPRQSADVASQREYLVSMNKVGRYVRQFVALPINFGITCHVGTQDLKEPDSDDLIYMPLIQGNGMPSKVCGYMNVVGYLHEKDEKKRLITQRTSRFYAKDRFNALGKAVINPTIPKIEKLIKEKSGSSKTSETKKKSNKTKEKK